MIFIVSRNTARTTTTTVVSSLNNTNTNTNTAIATLNLHLLPKVKFSTFSYASRFLFHNNVVGLVNFSIKVPTLFINKKNFSATNNSDERYAFLNNNNSTPCFHHYSQNQNPPSSFGYHHQRGTRAIESKRNKLGSGQDRSFSSSDNGNGSYYHYRQLQRRKNRHYSGGIANSQYVPHKFPNRRPPSRVLEVILKDGKGGIVPDNSKIYCSDMPCIDSADSWEWDNDEGQGFCWWGSVPVPPEFQLTTPTRWGSVPVPSEAQSTPTDPTKPIGDGGEQLHHRTPQCTIEQLEDFLKNNQVEEAVKLLKELEEKKGIFVDLPRYLQLIRACAEEGTLPYAKDVHNNLIRSKIPIDVNTYNRILDMYSNCGSMSDAYEVFEKNMTERNISSWDIMIGGLAMNGLGENAIDLFTQFKKEGLKPNGEIFIGVFLACSFLCDVGEGMLHFESMSKVYNIVPSMEHYWSVVNMLGSAGYLEEAMEFIRKMPFAPCVDVWVTLMNLCRVHGNIELGCHCAEIVNCLDTSRLTDISDNGLVFGKTSDAKEIMKQELYYKNVADAKFDDGYTSHPDKDRIFAFLKEIIVNLKAEGYVPGARYALYDVEEEDKEEVLLHHFEMIVVAAACLGTKPRGGFQFSLVKEHLCNDCHDAIKAISKLLGRKIIITNGKIHRFKDGLCSCKDYW